MKNEWEKIYSSKSKRHKNEWPNEKKKKKMILIIMD